MDIDVKQENLYQFAKFSKTSGKGKTITLRFKYKFIPNYNSLTLSRIIKDMAMEDFNSPNMTLSRIESINFFLVF